MQIVFLLQVPNLSTVSDSGDAEQKIARDLDDYFQSELLYHRNAKMATRIAQLLQQFPEESFFFAFGAGKTKPAL